MSVKYKHCQITGPALGSFLYSIGGFGLPFFTVGGLAFAVATAMIFIIPKVDHPSSNGVGGTENNNASGEIEENGGLNGSVNGGFGIRTRKRVITYRKVFACPTLLLPFCDALICFLGNGLIESMLQPYAGKHSSSGIETEFYS